MYFTVQDITLILAVGLVIGLLPSTIANRNRFRLISDIGISVAGVFVVAWLLVAWPDLFSMSEDLLARKPADNVRVEEEPNYEPVVLPLSPLYLLLKPVVYRSREEICDTLARAANNNDLPVHFFIRLLYQESSFRPAAISTAGAFGIAQFMPETATDRRLDNPFDPAQAIPASARLLRDLYRKFGNLGLAAAAYNAGPKRIEDWRANKGPLPQETRDYVKAITGWPLETWTETQAGGPAFKIPRGAPCQETAGLLAWDGPDEIPLPAPKPQAKEPAGARPVQSAAGGHAAKSERHTKTTAIAKK